MQTQPLDMHTAVACIVIAFLALWATPSDARKRGGAMNEKVDISGLVNPDPKATGLVMAEYNTDDDEMTEGDMKGVERPKGGAAVRGAATGDLKNKLWPRGRVPYEFASDLTSDEKKQIRTAIKDYSDNSCIKWVKRSGQKDYVEFQKSKQGCFAYLGRNGGKQVVNLGRGCWSKGTVVHEMMHAIGFEHEQKRGDRDQYVKIHFENIPEHNKHNFEVLKAIDETDLGTPYDFQSVMHYNAYAFTTDWNKMTITTKNPKDQDKIGQRAGFSKQDVEEIKMLYKCNGKKSAIGGKDGCLDKHMDYCENILGLAHDEKKRVSSCKYAQTREYCYRTCTKCDEEGTDGSSGGEEDNKETGTEPKGDCKDGEDNYCLNTLGLKDGPNHACDSKPHAEYCKKSCKLC